MAVTIRDVARAAGVSISTVSKVMNGAYSISDETAARVGRVMEELDYHPNARARSLAGQYNHTVVFLTALHRNIAFHNPHMFEIISGIEHSLSERHYQLAIKNVTIKDAPGYIKEIYDTKRADGFLIHASVISPELDRLLDECGIPHLVIGRPELGSRYCWIDIDNIYAGSLAAKYLLSRGYERPAFIGGEQGDRISAHRQNGLRRVLNGSRRSIDDSYICNRRSEPAGGADAMRSLLSLPLRPDSVICANSYLAYGCLDALKEASVELPEEIGVITFDEYPLSCLSSPLLTVVNIDVYDLGVEAGRKIIQKIRRPEIHIQSEITYSEVIARETTR